VDLVAQAGISFCCKNRHNKIKTNTTLNDATLKPPLAVMFSATT
jgi:hypothetical protein